MYKVGDKVKVIRFWDHFNNKYIENGYVGSVGEIKEVVTIGTKYPYVVFFHDKAHYNFRLDEIEIFDEFDKDEWVECD